MSRVSPQLQFRNRRAQNKGIKKKEVGENSEREYSSEHTKPKTIIFTYRREETDFKKYPVAISSVYTGEKMSPGFVNKTFKESMRVLYLQHKYST